MKKSFVFALLAATPLALPAQRVPNTDLVIPDVDSVPERLSDMPALWLAGKGRGHEVPGVFFYEPSAKLWSDFGQKERYIAVPGTEQVELTMEDGWIYPDRSLIIKNFALPLDERDPDNSALRIETRLLYLKDGQWHGYSYQWNEDETDAVLLDGRVFRPFTIIDPEGNPFQYSWLYPSATDCLQCHNSSNGHTAGVSTPALNYITTYPGTNITANQLEHLATQSLFTGPLPAPVDELPRMVDYSDPSEPLEARAKAYLDMNCATCHRPGGSAGVDLDLRYVTSLKDMDILGGDPQTTAFGNDIVHVMPKDLDNSLIYVRMNELNPVRRMPPVASYRKDEQGIEIIRQWILSIESDRDTWAFY